MIYEKVKNIKSMDDAKNLLGLKYETVSARELYWYAREAEEKYGPNAVIGIHWTSDSYWARRPVREHLHQLDCEIIRKGSYSTEHIFACVDGVRSGLFDQKDRGKK